MDIGENLDWIGHAVLDAEMRMICGLPAVKDPNIPLLSSTRQRRHRRQAGAGVDRLW